MPFRSLALCALALAGCDDHLLGRPTDDAVPSAYTCDWEGVQAFFQSYCDACHTTSSSGSVGSGGFDLRVEIEADLADDDHGNNAYVIPGNPGDSVLWQSLAGTGTAILMPLGYSEPLDDAIIEHVRCWIAEGAPL